MEPTSKKWIVIVVALLVVLGIGGWYFVESSQPVVPANLAPTNDPLIGMNAATSTAVVTTSSTSVTTSATTSVPPASSTLDVTSTSTFNGITISYPSTWSAVQPKDVQDDPECRSTNCQDSQARNGKTDLSLVPPTSESNDTVYVGGDSAFDDNTSCGALQAENTYCGELIPHEDIVWTDSSDASIVAQAKAIVAGYQAAHPAN